MGVKQMNQFFKHALGMSVILAFCSNSYAELTEIQNNSGNASLTWSNQDVHQLMSDDVLVDDDGVEISPQGSTNITTTLRSGSIPSSSTTFNNQSTAIRDTDYRAAQPSVNARAALLLDAKTGEVLYSKNTNTALPIASITKLMTAVVTSDANLNMSQQITLEPIDFIGPKKASSTLRVGDTMNRAEVLLFALMKSENPAASALARTYPGGKEAFVAAMNAKARKLGMTSTRYYEPTGLDARNVASARDLGILVSVASQYGLIRQFSSTASYDFNLGYRVLRSNNTNALVRSGMWNVNLSKTGYINEAGRCVVMHTTVNSRPAILVLLGASTSQARTNDATNLLTYFGNKAKRI